MSYFFNYIQRKFYIINGEDFKKKHNPAFIFLLTLLIQCFRLDLILEARNFDTNISAESVYFKEYQSYTGLN